MALDVVWGHVSNRLAVEALIAELQKKGVDGVLYLGYPVLPQADSTTKVEALLISLTPGLIAFCFPTEAGDIEARKQEQDSLAYAVEGNLQKHESLRSGRRLAVGVNTISFFAVPNAITRCSEGANLFASPEELGERLASCSPVEERHLRALRAAVERVTNIKPVKKRENVQRRDSRGAILKEIERQVANLDQWQRRASIETPEGPQRVRGLAGSGKTVVLALKAAYLHTQHSDWQIAVTFHTLSLSPQFTDLTERFTLEHSGDKPDPQRLQILHSWGSYGAPGVYSKIAGALGVAPVDFGAAKARYGRRDAFAGICRELLPLADKTPPNLFDAVLIDEAQDLPPEFLQLVHASTREPKRIVWAYDELQNLNNTLMPNVRDLFRGKVSVHNAANAPQADIILDVCYRNTPWALTLAHALGFGLYRDAGLVQLFDELQLWEDIGYQTVAGTLDFDADVTLKRKASSYPSFFDELLTPADAVSSHRFETTTEQYEWIAAEIQKNITDDELDPDDVLVIFPDAYRAQSHFHDLAKSLGRRGIQCHLTGVSSRRDVFQVPGSVTVSGIYRAKGNEAPMVYVANADHCAQGQEMISLRNTLFTAITRSRAWVRICGVGEDMDLLNREIDKVRSNEYKLSFHILTESELQRIRLINRDRSDDEKRELARAENEIDRLQKLIKDGTLSPANSRKLQELMALLGNDEPSGEE